MVNVLTGDNYIIIEVEDGDTQLLVDEVNTKLSTNLWNTVGGIAVKANGSLVQVLERKLFII